jgi:hypothetical protein
MCNFVGVVLGLHAFLYALFLIPYAKSFIELPCRYLIASMQPMPMLTTHVAEVITTPEKEKASSRYK